MGQLDYGLIGNCQVSALIDREGRYVWSCLPRFDSPAVFASLLGDENNGVWSILPGSEEYETKQSYVQNTNVLQTEFHLKNGDRFDIIDFAPRFGRTDGSYYRPTQFMRIIRPVKGTPRIRFRLLPRFEYGSEIPEAVVVDKGILYRTNNVRLFLQTDVPTTYVLDEKAFEIYEDMYCILSYGEPMGGPIKFRCEEALERTLSYWRRWVQHCKIPAEYQEAVIRSALALKLHIFEDTGAIIAATTTSLPEGPVGGRCWDYRYCWLRDSYFTINALMQLGQFEEMERFIRFLQTVSSRSDLRMQPLYGIGGERQLEEREIPWLKGFKGVGPVRVGNHAYTHQQHDIYGEMVLGIAPCFFDSRLDRRDNDRTFELVKRLCEQSIAIFDKADAGLWEFRSEGKHYLFSKLMCWSAVDRGVKIASKLGYGDLCDLWIPIRDRMRAVIEAEGWDETLGFYTQSLNGKVADASNLLMLAVNFHAADHERYRKMVDRYQKLLTVNGYVFRYKNADDFGVPMNAFIICNYWMVDALAAVGRLNEARALFETLLGHANHVGLISEDVDPQTGELWGNFPQAYSHVGLINSAIRISKPWDEVF